MGLHTFLADSAPEAVTQIRQRLGPEAVVVNVRKLPSAGLSRLWQKPRIEVLAYRPEAMALDPNPPDALTELRQELLSLKQKMECRESQQTQTPSSGAITALPQDGDALSVAAWPNEGKIAQSSACQPQELTEPTVARTEPIRTQWRIGSVLESTGLLPLHAQQVIEALTARHGATPPASLLQEVQLASKVLAESWRAPSSAEGNSHVFIGAPGSGKTTCLCQWLARTVLLEGKPARVWRLDGQTANNAESLSVYAEILDVSLERFRPEELPPDREQLFIDLPGVSWTQPRAVEELATQMSSFPTSQVHLVMNAAYDTGLLFAQIRAFARLPIRDLIFTHLDEERRWGKLWNFVLGTNYVIGCLGAGQNVPGDFQFAAPEVILRRQFLRK